MLPFSLHRLVACLDRKTVKNKVKKNAWKSRECSEERSGSIMYSSSSSEEEEYKPLLTSKDNYDFGIYTNR